MFAHWAPGQDGRAAGSARRADGTGRRDGRRAQHPVESCDFCTPGHRSLCLPLQETHLRDMDDPSPRSNVSTSQSKFSVPLQFQGLIIFYYNSAHTKRMGAIDFFLEDRSVENVNKPVQKSSFISYEATRMTVHNFGWYISFMKTRIC